MTVKHSSVGYRTCISSSFNEAEIERELGYHSECAGSRLDKGNMSLCLALMSKICTSPGQKIKMRIRI
jgi:hypothetical protein